MSNERPSLLTTGSTVSAAENIVAWLKPELLNEPQQNKPDRVSVIDAISASSAPRLRSKPT